MNISFSYKSIYTNLIHFPFYCICCHRRVYNNWNMFIFLLFSLYSPLGLLKKTAVVSPLQFLISSAHWVWNRIVSSNMWINVLYTQPFTHNIFVGVDLLMYGKFFANHSYVNFVLFKFRLPIVDLIFFGWKSIGCQALSDEQSASRITKNR